MSGSATDATASIETNRENLPAALRLAGEILKEATLPASEFELARQDELTSLDYARTDPQALAFNQLGRTVYPFPKGDPRATLTFEEETAEAKAAKLEDAQAFYKNFYGASNAELAVVGDFDAAAVKKTVDELFANWKSPAKFERLKTGFQRVAPVNLTIETPDKANAVFAASERVNMSDQDADYPAMVMANYMLGGGFLNSRLATRIRVKDGLSYTVSSSFGVKATEKDGQFRVFAISAPQNVAKVEAAFKEEMEKALKDGFTAKEIDAARAGWLQSRQLGRSEDRSLAGTLAARDFDNRTMAFDEALEKKVMALTPEQITAALRKNIDMAAISIVKAGDFKKAAAK